MDEFRSAGVSLAADAPAAVRVDDRVSGMDEFLAAGKGECGSGARRTMGGHENRLGKSPAALRSLAAILYNPLSVQTGDCRVMPRLSRCISAAAIGSLLLSSMAAIAQTQPASGLK